MSVIWVNVHKRHLEGQPMSRDDEKLAVVIVVIVAFILACWLIR